ncbi:MAG: hypothetical protein WBE13_19740 [Candidatus Acidiferrum sp.]
MSPLFLNYPSWKEMFGRRPTDAELLDEIRLLETRTVVPILAWINLLLVLDRFHSNEQSTYELQTFLVNRFLDDDLFARLRDTFGQERLVIRRPFHSFQVLTLMKRVIADGTNIGELRTHIDNESAYRLGRCLMMINDFLVTPENISAISPNRPPTKRKIALQLQLGSGLEVNNPPLIHSSIVRSDMIFGDLAKRSLRPTSLRNAFERSCGMTLEDYVDHILGLLTYYITLDYHKLIEDPGLACIAVKTFFAEAPQDIVGRFWLMECMTMEELETSVRERSRLKPHHDFIALRKKPFVETGQENVIPLHLGFVQEKLESGLFWAVFNSLQSREDRSLLFTEWGHLFEEYVSQTLAQSLAGSPENYVPFPTFSDNGEEAFDGIVSAGEFIVVMEYKGGFLNANAKYAENEDEFVRDVDRKFGGQRGGGVEQLVRKISAVFADRPANRRSLNGLDTSAIKIVIPVLVVQDSFVGSEITASYLADVFETLRCKERLNPSITCTSMQVMDISDIEILRPFLLVRKISLTQCLLERARMDGVGLRSFRDFFRQYLRHKNVGWVFDDETMARFEQIMDRISRRFFKKPLEAA